MSQTQEIKDILTALIELNNVSKILDTFIPAFENSVPREGHHYLHGNFNLGGTKSGRMSSSNINLQNLPSTGSKYAKTIKKCFAAPEGWLFVGSDFSSLEDRISALVTKDPNKLKVYLDGYDGHSLRAYSYFGSEMPDIDGSSVQSINSISTRYPQFRQLSKAPTFALTYAGTYITLMKNCGFDEKTAKNIEKQYHDLYSISDQWTADRLSEAERNGFVELAFGLRLRTPLIKQTLLNKRVTPIQAQAEARTAGNALIQSYGLLTNRAGNAFMEKVWNSEYKNDIKQVAAIHDALYYLIKKDPEVIKFTNDNLIKEMEWQELDAIKHNEVKLGAELDIFYPDWSNPITLPNNASINNIKELLNSL
jgi:DNA polymerase-1